LPALFAQIERATIDTVDAIVARGGPVLVQPVVLPAPAAGGNSSSTDPLLTRVFCVSGVDLDANAAHVELKKDFRGTV
jgi:hypothetical protein